MTDKVYVTTKGAYMITTQITAATKRAVKKYGDIVCLKASYLYHYEGKTNWYISENLKVPEKAAKFIARAGANMAGFHGARTKGELENLITQATIAKL